MAINGLLARIGFAYSNNGHVVPHEAMPDGAESAMLMVPTNAHLRLRAEHHVRFDKHIIRATGGNVLVVHRRDGGKRSPQGTQRVYVSLLDARALRYRGVWRSGSRTWWLADGEQRYEAFEQKLALGPKITIPTITLEGDANGAPHPEPSAYAGKFSGPYEHRLLTGGIGHNLPQEAPVEFAEAIIRVASS